MKAKDIIYISTFNYNESKTNGYTQLTDVFEEVYLNNK